MLHPPGLLQQHRIEVDMGRHAIKQQVNRLAEQAQVPSTITPAPQAGNRVQPGPALPQGQAASHHHPSRYQCVSRHVQEGAAQVQVVPLPRMNSRAVAVLMTMPTPATTITVSPARGWGDCSLSTASQASEPMATRSSRALMNAARMLAF